MTTSPTITLTLFEASALALALVLLGAAIGGHYTDSWYRNNLRRARKAGRLVWKGPP